MPDPVVPPPPEVPAATSSGGAAAPVADDQSSSDWLQTISKKSEPLRNVLPLILFVAAIVAGWHYGLQDAKNEAREELEAARKELDARVAAATKKVDLLKANQARLWSYLRSSQEVTLDHFRWICHERGGQFHSGQKTCSYLGLRSDERFPYLEFKDPPVVSP